MKRDGYVAVRLPHGKRTHLVTEGCDSATETLCGRRARRFIAAAVAADCDDCVACADSMDAKRRR